MISLLNGLGGSCISYSSLAFFFFPKEIQTPPSGNRSDAPSTSKDKLTPSNSKDSLSYRRQFEQNLDKAMTRGKMSPADYHKQKLLMVETEMQGVDSGSTRTQGK